MIIIPARISSNRFPNKILVDIYGKPMMIATANRVKEIDDVLIATDSYEVVEIAKKFNFKAVMTSKKHKSGTDRINEAVNILGLNEDEIVINVQADEPFIEPEVVQKLHLATSEIRNSDILMTSCYKLIKPEFANDPNHVKVIIDNFSNAIYFSRSKIPYDREEHLDYFGHLGLYGFTKQTLNRFCALPSSPLEDIEKLEQLRAIYNNEKIKMVQVDSQSFGIDTPKDLENALKIFS